MLSGGLIRGTCFSSERRGRDSYTLFTTVICRATMTLMHSSDANGIEAEIFGWVDKWSFLRERLLIWVRAIFTRIWVFKRKCFELDDREREDLWPLSACHAWHGMAFNFWRNESPLLPFVSTRLRRREIGATLYRARAKGAWVERSDAVDGGSRLLVCCTPRCEACRS